MAAKIAPESGGSTTTATSARRLPLTAIKAIMSIIQVGEAPSRTRRTNADNRPERSATAMLMITTKAVFNGPKEIKVCGKLMTRFNR